MLSRILERLSVAWKLTGHERYGAFYSFFYCAFGLALGLVILGAGLKAWIGLPRREALIQVEGEVAHVLFDSTRHERRTKYGGLHVEYVRHLTFSLRGHDALFYYDDRSPHFDWLKRKLKSGAPAKLGYLPGGGVYSAPLEIRVDASNILTWKRSQDNALIGALGTVFFGIIVAMGSGFLFEITRLELREKEAESADSKPS